MTAFVGHPCPAPELPMADMGPLRSSDGVLDVCLRVERAADELTRIREESEAEMLRMIATMDANQVAYFMKEAGRG